MFSAVLKFNKNHDKLGRFSSVGAGPAEKFSKELNKPHYTPEEMVSKAFNGNKDLIDEFHAANARVKKAVEAGGESYRQHATNLDALDSGKTRRVRYSADRLKTHRQIIDSILDGSSKYKAKEGEAPEALFLGGRGGSGKGNFHKSKGHDSGLYDSKSHLLLDPDEVKKRMKEYDPEMAYLTHKESADIFDKLVSEARRRKLNVVLDTTMRSPLNHVVSRFEKHGYSMQAHFMHMPPEGAALRALQRWSKGEDTPSGTKTKRGRLVPPDVIYAMKNNEKNFDSILPKMKKWSVWSNDKPLGVPPEKVDSSDSRKVKKGFSSVLKFNPYHDELGRFSDHSSARFVSTSGVFAGKRPGPAPSSNHELHGFVDFDAPLKRVEELNKKLQSQFDEQESWGLKVNRLIVEVPKEGAGIGGLSENDIRDAFSPKHVSVYMAMSRATLKKVLGGDTIKNSLETGKGTFSVIGEDRAIKEKEFLGVKAETSHPENFPKYGFVSSKGVMNDHGIVGFGYGDVYLEFNDSVRKHTSVTIGDSYNGNSGPRFRIPAPIDHVSSRQFMGTDYTTNKPTKHIMDGFENYKNSAPADRTVHSLASGQEYIEAQIYGKLDSSHIAAVHIESKKVAEDVAKALKKQGLDIPIIPAKTHTVLSRLNDGIIEDWNRVSPEDVKNLGDEYIKKGWKLEGSNIWAKGWSKDLHKFNLPNIKKAMAKYPKAEDVPVALQRELMQEYITEARKGSSGTLPKVLHKKASVRDGFTNDVFNKELLNAYKH